MWGKTRYCSLKVTLGSGLLHKVVLDVKVRLSELVQIRL